MPCDDVKVVWGFWGMVGLLAACRAGFDPIDPKDDGAPTEDATGEGVDAPNVDAVDAAQGTCVPAACLAAGGASRTRA